MLKESYFPQVSDVYAYSWIIWKHIQYFSGWTFSYEHNNEVGRMSKLEIALKCTK